MSIFFWRFWSQMCSYYDSPLLSHRHVFNPGQVFIKLPTVSYSRWINNLYYLQSHHNSGKLFTCWMRGTEGSFSSQFLLLLDFDCHHAVWRLLLIRELKAWSYVMVTCGIWNTHYHAAWIKICSYQSNFEKETANQIPEKHET